ncbi:hypothetical protein [Streptomyces sp. NPDC088135]|uniref:NACHT and WD repeat domain-containing protein n=1 Tax=Streptomyces sp. NPDC088135 TaxID=3160993 RepID=UPI00343193E3
MCWPDTRRGIPPKDALDIALLWLEEPVPTSGGAVRWGRPGGVARIQFKGAGFPAFAADSGNLGQAEDLEGDLPVVSSSLLGWVLNCRDWPALGRDGERPWAGASGSAIFCHGRLVGVAVEDNRTMEWRRLHTAPIHKALSLRGFAELVTRHGHLNTTAKLEEVTADTPPLVSSRQRRLAPYRETIREIHTRVSRLVGRETELGAITAFAVGPPGYHLLTGEAWAGKTALLTEAVVTALPKTVDVVAYFLSQREADADSNRFLAAVVPQLAELLDEDPPQHLDVHHFRALWTRAAAAAAAGGRNLLLVVDGLDEDLRPLGSPSIAALLPATVPDHAHVLVSSRPNPELPTDVPANHPLRAIQPETLDAFVGSAELAMLASHELTQLKRHDPDDLALTILGMLTAAAGPLTVDDLAVLTSAPATPTPSHVARIRRLVASEAARSLQPIGRGKGVRYQFAHASLMQQAQADDDLTHPDYRLRIHDWADTWRKAGWPGAVDDKPRSTPLYLLGEYLTTLSDEPAMQQTLVGDIRWAVAAVQAIGVDQVVAGTHSAVQVPGAAAPAVAVHTILRTRAHQLRDRQSARDPRFVARHLCLEALERNDHALVTTLRDQLLSLSAPGPVPLWTTQNMNRALQFEVGPIADGVREITLLCDGRVLVVTGNVMGSRGSQLLVWDPAAAPGAEMMELGCVDRGRISSVAALPDGRFVTSINSSPDDIEPRYTAKLQIWDPSGRTTRAELYHFVDEWIDTVAVLHNASVITLTHAHAEQQLVRLFQWDPAHPETDPIHLGTTVGTHGSAVTMPDGRIIAIIATEFRKDEGWQMLLVETDPSRPGTSLAPLAKVASGGSLYLAGALPDGRIALGSGGDLLALWDPAQPGTPIIRLADVTHSSQVRGAVLSDGRMILETEGRLLSWDPTPSKSAPKELGRVAGGTLRDGVRLPDGRILTSSNAGAWGNEGKLQVWESSLADNKPSELRHPSAEISAIAVLPDGRVIYSTSGHTEFLRDCEASVLIWNPMQPSAPPIELGRVIGGLISVIAVLPDGRIATGSGIQTGDGGLSGTDDGRVILWDPARPGTAPIELGRADGGRISSIVVLPDGRMATGSGAGRSEADYGQVLLWDPARPGTTPIELGRVDGGHISSVAVLPDGRIVGTTGNITGDEGRVLIWDPTQTDNTPVNLGRPGNDRLTAVAALPDGRIVTGSYDPRGGISRTISIRELVNGRIMTGRHGSRGNPRPRLTIWEPDRPQPHQLELEYDIPGFFDTVEVLRDGRVASIAGGRLGIWDPSTPATTQWVDCDAEALAVAARDDGRIDLVALHQKGRSLSGWTVP